MGVAIALEWMPDEADPQIVRFIRKHPDEFTTAGKDSGDVAADAGRPSHLFSVALGAAWLHSTFGRTCAMGSSVMPSSGELRGFVRRPWSVSKAVVIGLVAGFLGAFFHGLLYRLGPSELTYIFYVVPSVFWTCAAVVVGILYWAVGKTQFRSGVRSTVNGLIALALFVLGVYGSVWCCWHHICMDGHMGHPPYAAWHYGFDFTWSGCLAVAVFLAWRVRSVLSVGLACFAAFLMTFRFLLGSAGGMYGGFPL